MIDNLMTDNLEIDPFIVRARQIKPGEILILRANKPLNQPQAAHIKAQIEARIGTGIPLLVVGSDWDVTVLKPPANLDDSNGVGFA